MPDARRCEVLILSIVFTWLFLIWLTGESATASFIVFIAAVVGMVAI